jgi:hypothetical protein
MLIDFACFGAGCVAGGYFVFQGCVRLYAKDLQKRPWTEEEKGANDGRGSYLIHAKGQSGCNSPLERTATPSCK